MNLSNNMETVDEFRLTPENTCLETLSPSEAAALFEKSRDTIHTMLVRCVLAVLNSGEESDDVHTMLDKYRDFHLDVNRTAAGIEIVLYGAPIEAFVSYNQYHQGKSVKVHKIIEGVRQNIFAVLRDLVFVESEMDRTDRFDTVSPDGITDAVFLILRNAGVFQKTGRHKVVVCFGGHAIEENEYEYTKMVGYQLGLRFMDVITGCGPGAMKGPMKGAAIAHAKQRVVDGRYIGISEPGIIASEAPNAITNPLVIMPDIEKRLEAFIRLGHGIIIFPGGAGTAEELMYILGILSHEKNKKLPFPIILTGPKSSAPYFESIDVFVKNTLGENASERYKIIIDDYVRVAEEMNRGLLEVKVSREKSGNSYYFNREIFIPPVFQEPFYPSHELVGEIALNPEDEPHLFAAALRRVFSSIVWGNVKPEGVKALAELGPLEIKGTPGVVGQIDGLLRDFISDGRMRLTGEYKPVYRIS